MGAGVWLVILWGVGAGGSLFEGFACLVLFVDPYGCSLLVEFVLSSL